MSHFYGILQGTRGKVTRCGDAKNGLTSIAACWKGAIEVELYVDNAGQDSYIIRQIPWEGVGEYKIIAEGVF